MDSEGAEVSETPSKKLKVVSNNTSVNGNLRIISASSLEANGGQVCDANSEDSGHQSVGTKSVQESPCERTAPDPVKIQSKEAESDDQSTGDESPL